MKYTLHNLLGFAPQIVWGGGSTGGGGGGGGAARSAFQGATSTARDPAVRKTGADKGTQTRGSSPRPPSRKPTTTERAIYSATGNVARDITMGLSTFGQSKEKQAETLRSKGYSDDVIKDYQERSAASMARALEVASKSDNDSGSATTTTTTDTSTDTDTTTTGTDTVLDETTDTALDTVEDISTQTFTETPDLYVGDTTGAASVGTAAGGVAEYEAAKPTSVGEAEDEALELMKKGRRATILTKPGGLLGTGEEKGQTRRRRSLIGG